jgi:hypothetical protein
MEKYADTKGVIKGNNKITELRNQKLCKVRRRTIQWLKEKGQLMIYKIIHRKQKIEQQPH